MKIFPVGARMKTGIPDYLAYICGYLDLVWLEEERGFRDRVFHARFFVSSSYNPPFDAILGTKDAATSVYGKLFK
jgi:hypothetical protein